MHRYYVSVVRMEEISLYFLKNMPYLIVTFFIPLTFTWLIPYDNGIWDKKKYDNEVKF